jgi:Icc-related predicted phosphoesterase
MQITTISDTHTQHNQLNLPCGDILIHAGDLCSSGSEDQVQSFVKWFAKQEYQYKIFIAGNHDFWLEQSTTKAIEKMIPKEVIYLNDSGVTINGINIWGSPVQPEFFDWAFNRQRGAAIKKHWDLIPADTDILITHGPAFGKLDRTTSGLNVGCDDLLTVIEKVKPKLHVCGHIHEGYGIQKNENSTFVNASVLNERYQMVNEPIVLDWNMDV